MAWFAAINALLVIGRDWGLLVALDSAALVTFATALAASRMWPDNIWLRGTR